MHRRTLAEAICYRKLPSREVECQVCLRRCRLKDGQKGYCLTRENRQGKLYSIIYGAVSTLHYSVAEKKPLYHFFPGEVFLSIGSLGCNFRCPGCQNLTIAHAEAEKRLRTTEFIPPERLVELAIENHSIGISWTYNEPTLWLEYILDGARLAKKKGLVTNCVTNGSITPEGLDLLGEWIDAFRVDIKAYRKETYRRIANFSEVEALRAVAERAKIKWNMHVECVTNVTPTINDDEEEIRLIAGWIREHLGPETPWHITRFYPAGALSHLPATPLSDLERLTRAAREEGLDYVYLGNVPGHPEENTFCPTCGTLLIGREGYRITKYALQGKRCPKCAGEIYGRFR